MRSVSASLSAKVNQQCYFAELLLSQVEQLDAKAAQQQTLKLALEQSVLGAMFLAYQGFVQELAQSCQIKQPVDSIEQLDQYLRQEQRSHAVVHNLLELTKSNTWLSQLIDRFDKRLQAVPKQNTQPQLIASSEQYELPEILVQLQDFISQQREFLQEW